ncbi:hypothetical protein KKF84_05630 [Myxococcota bacterium]|nr:hypothetical protein [Myxococcota bacterium]MBU1534779.1 hypothetical protein [Myxococcota bacterium]
MRIALLLTILIFTGCKSRPTSTERRDSPFKKAFKSEAGSSESCKTPLVWYKDQDHDGWGDATSTKTSCAKPEGYVSQKGDCDDNDYRAFPNQKSYFSIPRKNGSFDFDCDGKQSVRLINRAYCKEKENGGGCALASGWDISASRKIPACGVPEQWAWNECRAEIIGETTVSASPLEILKAMKPVRKAYHCWKGKLTWKKRQLCR